MQTHAFRLDHERRDKTAVSTEKAVRIAVAYIPADLLELDLGIEQGRVVREVQVRAASGTWEFDIDAKTGEIVNLEADN